MYQYAKVFSILMREGDALTEQGDQFQNSICRLDKMGGRFQYHNIKVLQCCHTSYNFKYFLQNLNKTTFGFMASNVSKCAQTFSASVMTYLQLKGLVLQCHCTALNAVKRSQMKPFGFMASYVSKCAQLFSDSAMNCSQKQLLLSSIKYCQKQSMKQFGFMASNVSKNYPKIQYQCYDL